MRRNWLFLALLLSVGLNCGLLGMGLARHRMQSADRLRDERPPGRDGALLADRLALEGEARERFMRLQRELAERVHAGRQQIDDARRDLRRELPSPASRMPWTGLWSRTSMRRGSCSTDRPSANTCASSNVSAARWPARGRVIISGDDSHHDSGRRRRRVLWRS